MQANRICIKSISFWKYYIVFNLMKTEGIEHTVWEMQPGLTFQWVRMS